MLQRLLPLLLGVLLLACNPAAALEEPVFDQSAPSPSPPPPPTPLQPAHTPADTSPHALHSPPPQSPPLGPPCPSTTSRQSLAACLTATPSPSPSPPLTCSCGLAAVGSHSALSAHLSLLPLAAPLRLHPSTAPMVSLLQSPPPSTLSRATGAARSPQRAAATSSSPCPLAVLPASPQPVQSFWLRRRAVASLRSTCRPTRARACSSEHSTSQHTRHTSHITRHTSHITRHTSHIPSTQPLRRALLQPLRRHRQRRLQRPPPLLPLPLLLLRRRLPRPRLLHAQLLLLCQPGCDGTAECRGGARARTGAAAGRARGGSGVCCGGERDDAVLADAGAQVAQRVRAFVHRP